MKISQNIRDVRSHPVFNSELVGVIVWGEDFTIRDANDAFLEMAGLDYQEAVGTSWQDLTPEEFYSVSESHIREVEETGSGVPYEKQYYHPDGSRWWGLFESLRLNDSEKVEFVIDITERVLAEKKLRESEERYRRTFENAAVGIANVTPGGKFLRVNDKLCDFLGYEREELLGLNLKDVSHKEDMDKDRQQIDRILNGEIDFFSMEKRYVKKDGKVVWGDLSNSVLRSPEGNPRYLIKAVQEITERKEAERELQQQAELDAFRVYLNDAIRPLTDPVAVQRTAMECLAEHLNVMRASYYEMDEDQDGFTQTVGYETEDTVELPEQMRISDYGAEIIEEYRAGRTVVVDDTETVMQRESQRQAHRVIGVRAWVGVPLVKDGRLVIVLGVHHSTPRNWTNAEVQLIEEVAERTWAAVERARAKNDLRESEKRLEQRTRALQNSRMKLRSLVNELSHAEENQRYILAGELHDNLGQILEVCKMKFDLLMKDNDDNFPAEVHEIRDLINESINCTRRLVNDLKPAPTEEKEDLDSALKWVAGKMEKHGLDVNIENSENQKPVAQQNLNTLVQAVQELLFNVVKHAETDQAWITVNRLKKYVQIKVKDKGRGFDPKHVKESSGQDGFGLFNIRQRIDLLGGTFNIESEPGKGTTATVQIPLKNAEQFDWNSQPLNSTINRGLETSASALISVLVVDDHKMMREGIAGIINAESDMTVSDEASNGEEAISIVSKIRPDVVIMDVNLPGINGIEATRKIKAEFPNTKVIGLSFLNDQDLISSIFNAGASDFISKDEALQSICQAVREVVS